MTNPYDAPKSQVADPAHVAVKRPLPVTIAVVILWLLLAIWASGAIRQIMHLGIVDAPTRGVYGAVLVAVVGINVCLIVMIARARRWARFVLAALYGARLAWRLYLLSTVDVVTTPMLKSTFVPAAVQLVAIALLWVPSADAWFRSAEPAAER